MIFQRAQQLGRVDEERLLKDRKLVLLVDLDQTLIHTTNDNVPPNLKVWNGLLLKFGEIIFLCIQDVHHFQLYGPHSPWYHTRLRPLTLKFLQSMFKLYELHICTFGARLYAHTIAKMLDIDERLFSHRILSRDECFDPHSKTANLS
jgi:RNA polymerase II subunit A C-terminal domain phosphatase